MNRRSDERLDPLTLAAKHLLDQSVEALDQKTVLSVQRAGECPEPGSCASTPAPMGECSGLGLDRRAGSDDVAGGRRMASAIRICC